MPQTGWLRDNKHFFLTILEAGIQDQGASMTGSGKGPLLGCRLLTVVLTWQKGQGNLSGASLTKVLSNHEGSTTVIYVPPKGPMNSHHHNGH